MYTTCTGECLYTTHLCVCVCLHICVDERYINKRCMLYIYNIFVICTQYICYTYTIYIYTTCVHICVISKYTRLCTPRLHMRVYTMYIYRLHMCVYTMYRTYMYITGTSCRPVCTYIHIQHVPPLVHLPRGVNIHTSVYTYIYMRIIRISACVFT